MLVAFVAALHVPAAHCVGVALRSGQKLPAPHGSHVVDPSLIWKVPGGHGFQGFHDFLMIFKISNDFC